MDEKVRISATFRAVKNKVYLGTRANSRGALYVTVDPYVLFIDSDEASARADEIADALNKAGGWTVSKEPAA